MDPKIVHIVSCAASTPMQDIPWHEERYMLKIDCNQFPEKAISLLSPTTTLPKNENESQDCMTGLTFLTESYNQALSFVRQDSGEHELSIYCTSEEGLFRAIAIATKLAEFLSSQGVKVELWHNELRARGIQ